MLRHRLRTLEHPELIEKPHERMRNYSQLIDLGTVGPARVEITGRLVQAEHYPHPYVHAETRTQLGPGMGCGNPCVMLP